MTLLSGANRAAQSLADDRDGAPAAARQRVIEVSDLSVSFPGAQRTVQAVRMLGFHVDAGETLAIVGESGSGKSVMSLALMRLVEQGGGRLDSGSMWLTRRSGERLDLAKASQAQMRGLRGADLAMVFQEPMTALNPVFTVGEQIAESVRLHQGLSYRAALAEALRLLDLVRIPEARSLLGRHPHQLSGGMRQRVVIAMALACKPALLIADEPTTALDVTIQAQILALVQQLQRELSMGVIFITHDMGVVAEVADRVLVMWRGDKVEENTCAALFAQPREPYTRALLAAVPRLGAMQGQDLPRRFEMPGVPATSAAEADTVRHDQPAVLQVQDLVTRFALPSGLLGRVRRQVHAVEQLSFELKPGETLSLVGESGCGKSTTGRSLARLVDFQSGSVKVAGRDIAGLKGQALQALRRDIQFVFQDPFASLDPRLTVGYSVIEPMLIHRLLPKKEAEARVGWLLGKVGLPADAANRYPHEFSGGQRQRVAIARALLADNGLLLLDDALSAVDTGTETRILQHLEELRRRRPERSAIIASHRLSAVVNADLILVLRDGHITETGKHDALMQRDGWYASQWRYQQLEASLNAI